MSIKLLPSPTRIARVVWLAMVQHQRGCPADWRYACGHRRTGICFRRLEGKHDLPPMSDSSALPAPNNGRARTSLGDCCCHGHSLLYHAPDCHGAAKKVAAPGREERVCWPDTPTPCSRCDTKTRRNTRRLPGRRLVRRWNSHKTPSLGHIEHLFSSAPQYPHAKVPRRVLIRSQSSYTPSSIPAL